MNEVIMENCKCVCEGVAEAGTEVAKSLGTMDYIQMGIVGLVVILVIIALIIGFGKLKGGGDFDEDEDSDETYY